MQYTLAESFTIQPDEQGAWDVLLDVPHETSATLGNVDVWAETELDIELAVDPEDRGYLDVQPTPWLQAVFDAPDDPGFLLHTVECETGSHGVFTSSRHSVQEFKFRPALGPPAGDVDGLEVAPQPDEDTFELFLEVDRRGNVLSELGDLDERTVQTAVRATDVSDVRDELESLIHASA